MNKKLYDFILQFITCKEKDCKGCEADIVAIDKACRVELARELSDEDYKSNFSLPDWARVKIHNEIGLKRKARLSQEKLEVEKK